MLGNMWWTIQLNKVRGNHELVQYWKEECEKKDNQLREFDRRFTEIVEKKKQLKDQYIHQLAYIKTLEGRLAQQIQSNN